MIGNLLCRVLGHPQPLRHTFTDEGVVDYCVRCGAEVPWA